MSLFQDVQEKTAVLDKSTDSTLQDTALAAEEAAFPE